MQAPGGSIRRSRDDIDALQPNEHGPPGIEHIQNAQQLRLVQYFTRQDGLLGFLIRINKTEY